MIDAHQYFAAALLLGAVSVLTVACGDDVGGVCSVDDDCADGFCCQDKNCAGMCTFECDGDADCPEDMACEHGVCFFRCESDEDCTQEGFTCEHDNTVCEAD